MAAHDALAETLLRLHERAVDGDQAAVDELVTALLPVLHRRLRRAFPSVPADLAADAATDAILDYVRSPGRFDRNRGVALEQFLYRAGWRNLADAVDSERRRQLREHNYASSPLSLRNDDDDRADLEGDEIEDELEHRVLAAARNDAERRACRYLVAGERATSVIARALELLHLPTAEQRREVKRFKDRLLKRIARQRDRSNR